MGAQLERDLAYVYFTDKRMEGSRKDDKAPPTIYRFYIPELDLLAEESAKLLSEFLRKNRLVGREQDLSNLPYLIRLIEQKLGEDKSQEHSIAPEHVEVVSFLLGLLKARESKVAEKKALMFQVKAQNIEDFLGAMQVKLTRVYRALLEQKLEIPPAISIGELHHYFTYGGRFKKLFHIGTSKKTLNVPVRNTSGIFSKLGLFLGSLSSVVKSMLTVLGAASNASFMTKAATFGMLILVDNLVDVYNFKRGISAITERLNWGNTKFFQRNKNLGSLFSLSSIKVMVFYFAITMRGALDATFLKDMTHAKIFPLLGRDNLFTLHVLPFLTVVLSSSVFALTCVGAYAAVSATVWFGFNKHKVDLNDYAKQERQSLEDKSATANANATAKGGAVESIKGTKFFGFALYRKGTPTADTQSADIFATVLHSHFPGNIASGANR